MFSPCRRYQKVKNLQRDGIASRRQLDFIDLHEANCTKCVAESTTMSSALDLLRSAVIEVPDDKTLETRIIRRWRMERKAQMVSYWIPAVTGAVVTGAAILAVLQILVSTPKKQNVDISGQEALLENNSQIEIPDYFEPSPVESR